MTNLKEIIGLKNEWVDIDSEKYLKTSANFFPFSVYEYIFTTPTNYDPLHETLMYMEFDLEKYKWIENLGLENGDSMPDSHYDEYDKDKISEWTCINFHPFYGYASKWNDVPFHKMPDTYSDRSNFHGACTEINAKKDTKSLWKCKQNGHPGETIDDLLLTLNVKDCIISTFDTFTYCPFCGLKKDSTMRHIIMDWWLSKNKVYDIGKSDPYWQELVENDFYNPRDNMTEYYRYC